jgi:hypothetical protein
MIREILVAAVYGPSVMSAIWRYQEKAPMSQMAPSRWRTMISTIPQRPGYWREDRESACYWFRWWPLRWVWVMEVEVEFAQAVVQDQLIK